MLLLDGLEARTHGLPFCRRLEALHPHHVGVDFGQATLARAVCSLPVVDAASRRYPGAAFIVEGRCEVRQLLACHLRATGRDLCARGLDACDLVLDLRSGARRRARWHDGGSDPRLALAALHDATLSHRVARIADGARASGLEPTASAPSLALTRDARAAGGALARLSGRGALVALVVSGQARRSWGGARFAALAAALADRIGATCVQLGVSTVAGARRIPTDTPAGAVAGLLRLCCVCIGDDDGWSHVAAALGTPTVVLHGPTSPDVTGPSGRRSASVSAPCAATAGVHRRRPGRCLQCLRVEDVVPVAERLAAERWPRDRINRWLA